MRRLWLFFFLFFPPFVNAQADYYNITTPLDEGRQMYGTVAVGDYLYVIGGNMEPDVYTRTVVKARINSDGTLGSWEKTTPLPESLSYIHNTTLSLNNVIYVVQGLQGDRTEAKKTIFWTKPRGDGNLEDWQESSPCPTEGVNCSVAVATPGYIHLIGGSAGSGKAVSRVWSIRLDPGGAVMEWVQGPALPAPLWYHCGGLADGKVWIWGGLTGSSPNSVNDIVYMAPVQETGTLGPWQDSGSKLNQPFYSSASTVLGDYLVSFCPRYKAASVSGDIWYANVGSKGLSEWIRMDCAVPAKLYNAVATNYRLGIIYLPGGRFNKETLNLDKNVYYFTLAMDQQGESQAGGNIFFKAQPKTQGSTTPIATATQIPQFFQPEQSRAPVYALPAFLPFEIAKQVFAQNPRPTVIYFHSKTDKTCHEQAQILAGFQPGGYVNKVILAEVNRDERPDIFQQYGVTQVPFWLLYDSSGRLVSKSDKIIQLSDLTQALNTLAP